MIGIDTDLLVRFLVADDAAQKRKVDSLFANQQGAAWGYINTIVLCELFWILKSVYRLSRQEVAAMIEKLLNTQDLQFQDEALCSLALLDYRNGQDFADSLIGYINRSNQCTTTHTLDRLASELDSFTLLH